MEDTVIIGGVSKQLIDLLTKNAQALTSIAAAQTTIANNSTPVAPAIGQQLLILGATADLKVAANYDLALTNLLPAGTKWRIMDANFLLATFTNAGVTTDAVLSVGSVTQQTVVALTVPTFTNTGTIGATIGTGIGFPYEGGVIVNIMAGHIGETIIVTSGMSLRTVVGTPTDATIATGNILFLLQRVS